MKTEAEILKQLHEGLALAHSSAKQLAFMRAAPQYLQLAELLAKVERSAKVSATLAEKKAKVS